ncbi:NADP-dependent 3-hydroxy acid dehydrogenase YdfG [Georgenia satyanarayanai]|uniref:NADP-dependent 3-hydroxy acid dehydrogenase YdfG n=1 Tax=Georgenia satyanarayanai TaxID=860221 RepID=A0A2Y9A241_9MICO|nr:SDR family oxidoreductase [Georgenia satyanarayanai]PYG01759.1 NADP-dependent 3-hydroxy acid dehydrogenase YdfG [Georgenia satyanarayanai]SSA36559.1 NADP-dependent 3-hydroxy acid dehydrogenase YdfG [Georgenia satyanarayanai]
MTPDPARRVLVTGAARGIGRAVADALTDHELVLTVRRAEDVARLGTELPGARVLLLDLADASAIAERVAGVEVDAVVHCAGVEGVAPAAELDPARLAAVLAANLAGPVELTRVLLPGLRRSGGHVVFVSSTAVLGAFPGWAAYAASKAALRAYADTLRVEEPDVRVTSVLPGRTDTGMQHRIHEQAGRDFDPATAMAAASVAAAIRSVLTAPGDVEIPELVLTPFTHPGG